MTIEAYLNPDFTWGKKLIFLLLTFLGILLCDIVLIVLSRYAGRDLGGYARKKAIYDKSQKRVQCFYEMMISGTSVLSFSCAYVVLNHMYSLLLENPGAVSGAFAVFFEIWENGKDFALLVLICLSCILNTILDRFVIPLKALSKEEKASIRLLAMFYVIIILIILNYVGDESEYSPVMMYYLGLMVGRFVYFDASFADFVTAIKAAFLNLPLLLLGLLLTAATSVFGFSQGYLLERNYYIVGVFYTHLFLLIGIFIIHHTRFLHLFIRKPLCNS